MITRLTEKCFPYIAATSSSSTSSWLAHLRAPRRNRRSSCVARPFEHDRRERRAACGLVARARLPRGDPPGHLRRDYPRGSDQSPVCRARRRARALVVSALDPRVGRVAPRSLTRPPRGARGRPLAPAPAPPEEPANNGKAIAGAGFALGVALFVGGLGGGAPTLASLEKDAVPLDVALANGRPTVVEFYADWCEVCKESAPNVFDVERRFGDDVNFVMLNIDNTKWGGEMDQYGVDGIPHIVFLDRKGVSEGQVVGKFPKQALEANVEALARGDPRLPVAKLADGAASPVQVAGIVETPGSTVDDPRGGAVSSADPRFHG